jgi:hypothetical protein
MKWRLAVVGVVVSLAAISITVRTTHADPDLPNVPKHRHFIRTASGSLVEVGPRVCDDAKLQRAFNQFHNNVHSATGSAIGPAAPGLHNFQGAEILFSGC